MQHNNNTEFATEVTSVTDNLSNTDVTKEN